MDKYDNIRERLQRLSHVSDFLSIQNAFVGATGAGIRIRNQGEALRKEGKLTKAGISEKLREFARTETLPALNQASAMVKRMRDDVKSRRAALGLKPVDKTDLVAAMLRSEVRAWIKGMDQSGKAAVLFDDSMPDIVIQAVFELPPQMIGATPQFLADVQKRIVERDFGPTLAVLDEIEEAATVLDVAVNFATGDMKDETGFLDSPNAAYEAWAGQAAA